MPDDTLLLIPYFLAVNYVTVLAHEMGHAVLASFAGYRVTACGLGLGRPIARVDLLGTVLYLCWRKPFQGLTFSQSTRSDHPRSAEAVLLVGGLAAHVLLIAIAYPVYRYTGHWTVAVVLWLNVAYLAIGMIPIRFRVGGALIESDALRIIRVMTARPSRTKIGTRRSAYAQCLDHLSKIGDRVGVYAYAAEQAMLELECGQVEAARALLTATEPPPRTPRYLVGRQHLARGLAAGEAGEDEQAAAELAAAESAFVEDDRGRLMVDMARLEIPASGNDVGARALELLDRDGLPAWAGDICRRLVVRALARGGDHEGAAGALESVDSPGWIAGWLRARKAEADGDETAALATYLEVLELLAPDLVGLPAGPLREGYLDQHEGLASSIRALAERTGKPEEVGVLDELIGREGASREPVESHLGVLAMYFVGTGLVVNLGLLLLLKAGIDAGTMRLFVTIGGTTSLAGFGAGFMALFTKDRKRLAVLAILLSVPASLLTLFYIGQLGVLARSAG